MFKLSHPTPSLQSVSMSAFWLRPPTPTIDHIYNDNLTKKDSFDKATTKANKSMGRDPKAINLVIFLCDRKYLHLTMSLFFMLILYGD